MKINSPKIIQGGMGAGVSGWFLAQAVSRNGQLGVVSGVGLDEGISRRLQLGDPGGHIRRVLNQFPFPAMGQRILDSLFIQGGKDPNVPYRRIPVHSVEGRREAQELSIVGNFVEVMLAREGHSNPVGINYLEKIQMPHLPSIYGALLAGVAVVIMGAGIPLAIPGVLKALSQHDTAEYPIAIAGLKGVHETVLQRFNPKDFFDPGVNPPELELPDFLPIVSSELLATILLRKASGPIAGFVIEGNLAGGHNAPPRKASALNERGEPIYGPRDSVNLTAFREIGLPFWLAGSTGSPEAMRTALEEGAAGIQVGTAFALCEESSILPEVRHKLIRDARAGTIQVFTDPRVSSTGFPFKVVQLEGTLSDPAIYAARKRICDLGFLRQAYRRPDGAIGYRCAAEPVEAYVAKGGLEADTVGRACLCNALVADIGMPQIRPDGSVEKSLITMGDDIKQVGRFCTGDSPVFTAADVIRVLLG